MLCDSNRTPYDWQFSLFGTPVRVQILFWFGMAIIGWNYSQLGLHMLAMFVVAGFMSILLHEFGHVWAGRFFGAKNCDIVLYMFGGFASSASSQRARWQRCCVYLAGPAIQLVFWKLLDIAMRSGRLDNLAPLAWDFLGILWGINLCWALFNLLPLMPFDGGNVLREIAEYVSPVNGERAVYGWSTFGTGFIAVNSLMAIYDKPHLPFLHFEMLGVGFFVLMAINNYQVWQSLQPTGREWNQDEMPWER